MDNPCSQEGCALSALQRAAGSPGALHDPTATTCPWSPCPWCQECRELSWCQEARCQAKSTEATVRAEAPPLAATWTRSQSCPWCEECRSYHWCQLPRCQAPERHSGCFLCLAKFQDHLANPYSFQASYDNWPTSFWNAVIVLKSGGLTTNYSGVPAFCASLENFYNGGIRYASKIYPYLEVAQNPALDTGIQQPKNLGRVAWLVCNARYGTMAKNGRKWNGTKQTGCSTITPSDFQSALWALVDKPGECDGTNGPQICTQNVPNANKCNVAYLYNAAVYAVQPWQVYVSHCGLLPVVIAPCAACTPAEQPLIAIFNTSLVCPTCH